MAAKSYRPLNELVSLQKANFASGRTTALQSSAERAGNILISKGEPSFIFQLRILVGCEAYTPTICVRNCMHISMSRVFCIYDPRSSVYVSSTALCHLHLVSAYEAWGLTRNPQLLANAMFNVHEIPEMEHES